MFYYDYHVHTNFSLDSDAPMEDMIRKAIELNLKEIMFTDHVDYDYPDENTDFFIDYDQYLLTFNKIKNKYSNKIDIKLGVEMGLQPHIAKDINDLIAKYDFDFIIGSTHAADKLDLYNGDFFKNKTQKKAYRRYFENVLENVSTLEDFDVCGHLDFIIRYGDFKEKKLNYDDFSDIVDEILKTLIKKDKGLEINTSGIVYGFNQTHPQLPILKRYKELGGKILTIGSDAHSPDNICAYFDKAYAMAKQVGFNEITTFRNRKPTFIKI